MWASRKVEDDKRRRCESMGNMEDLWKRKREDLEGKEEGEGEMEDVFRKSRKMGRSPVKGMVGNEREMSEMMRGWKEDMEEIMKELRGMKEMREELKQIKGGIDEVVKEQGRMLREEMEDVKRIFKEKETRWKEEREEMMGNMRELEKRIGELEKREGTKEVGGKIEGEMMKKGMDDKMKEIEWKLEKREREERRRNIIIKGLEEREGRRREVVEGLLRDIGVVVEIGEIKRIGGDKEKGREMIVVKLGSEEQKREVMRNKRKLKGRREKIMEDWTWKERRMRWKLEELAKNEERRGRRVWIGYGRIRIGEKWWRWDEEEGVLRDGKGNIRLEDAGEGGENGERGRE